MARKKKIISNTPYPQHAIDAVARCLWPDIVAFFEIVVEGKKKSEPISNLENPVRIICFWLPR